MDNVFPNLISVISHNYELSFGDMPCYCFRMPRNHLGFSSFVCDHPRILVSSGLNPVMNLYSIYMLGKSRSLNKKYI